MKLNSNLEVLKKTDKTSYSDQLFGIKKRIKVHHFSQKTELVPEIDKSYIFDEINSYRTNCSTTKLAMPKD